MKEVCIQALSFNSLFIIPTFHSFSFRYTIYVLFHWYLWVDNLNIWIVIVVKAKTSSIYRRSIIIPGIWLIKWYDWSIKASILDRLVLLSLLSIGYVRNISISCCVSVQLAVCGYFKHSGPLKLCFMRSRNQSLLSRIHKFIIIDIFSEVITNTNIFAFTLFIFSRYGVHLGVLLRF